MATVAPCREGFDRARGRRGRGGGGRSGARRSSSAASDGGREPAERSAPVRRRPRRANRSRGPCAAPGCAGLQPRGAGRAGADPQRGILAPVPGRAAPSQPGPTGAAPASSSWRGRIRERRRALPPRARALLGGRPGRRTRGVADDTSSRSRLGVRGPRNRPALPWLPTGASQLHPELPRGPKRDSPARRPISSRRSSGMRAAGTSARGSSTGSRSSGWTADLGAAAVRGRSAPPAGESRSARRRCGGPLRQGPPRTGVLQAGPADAALSARGDGAVPPGVLLLWLGRVGGRQTAARDGRVKARREVVLGREAKRLLTRLEDVRPR